MSSSTSSFRQTNNLNSSADGAHIQQHQQQQPEQQEVNKIFANNTIEQVATICRQMQQDVRLTQVELRNMIGDRHRELIDSCGELVGIDKVCRELVAICEEKSKREDEHRHGGGGSNNVLVSSKKRNNNINTNNNAHSKSTTANTTVADEKQKRKTWIDDQLLRSMRATSLLQEQDLLDAAVQISILERDVSLGIQSSISSSSSTSSSSLSTSLPHTTAGSSLELHALESTVRPLRDQWNTAAAKALSNMTRNRDVTSSGSISDEKERGSFDSSSSSSSSSSALFTLASCFQGWGLLSRASPKESLQHLLLDNLCKNAIDRILSSSSSTSEALIRCSKLLVFVSEFIVDLYRRGPLALVVTSNVAAVTSNNDDNNKSNSKSVLQDLLKLDGGAGAAGVHQRQQTSGGNFARSNSNGLDNSSSSQNLDPVSPTIADSASNSNNNNKNNKPIDPSTFLAALTHKVCALGVLDADNTFAPPSSHRAASSPSSPTSPSHPQYQNQQSSSSLLILQGWASPLPSTPHQHHRQQQQQKSFQDLLPTQQECAELFDQCCKTLFATTMSRLIQKATDPGQGEASCLKIIEKFTKMNSVNTNPAPAGVADSLAVLVKKLQSILSSQVCQIISSAAGSCILQHLSQCANELIAFANQNTTVMNSINTINNNGNGDEDKKNTSSSNSTTTTTSKLLLHQSQYTLFHVARSVLFHSNAESPLEPSSSSSASIRGRALLASLMKRAPGSENRRYSNSDENNNNNKQQQGSNASQRYHQQQLNQHLAKRGLSSLGRSASPSGASNGGGGGVVIGSNTSISILNSHVNKLNHLMNEIKLHAKNALQRSLHLQNSDKSSERVTEIILDLATRLADSAKIFVKNETAVLLASSTTTSANVTNRDESSSSVILQTGIAAAEAVRHVTDPLFNIVLLQQKQQQQQQQQPEQTTSPSSASSSNLQKSIDVVKSLQTELLRPWKNQVKSLFEQEALSPAINDSNINNIDDGKKGNINESSFLLNVASGSQLICRSESTTQDASSSSSSSSLSFPSRPSPSVLSALVNAVRRSTSLFTSSSLSSSSTSSSIFASSTTTSCPQHVRVELCAEICNGILKKGIDRIDEIVTANSKMNQTSNSNGPALKKEEFDLRILQLYFDICFAVLVLRGTTSPLQLPIFATVDVMRKDFIKKVESAVDVLTWSVTKSYINASIKSAVDESNCVSHVLPTATSLSSATKPSALNNNNNNAIQKTAALKMSVESASDRLPLLPLVALAPSTNINSHSMMNGGAAGGNNNNNSSSTTTSGMIGSGFSSFLIGGDGSASDGSDNNNNTVGRAAKELMAQGTAFTSKLKSVFQW